MLSLILLLPLLCQAHNWIRSNSRSTFANTIKPCLPRRNFDYPHVMIGPDPQDSSISQSFQVEWATGHNSNPSYFMLVKAEDEHHLRKATRKFMEEFIAAAPADQANNIPPKKFRKYARKPDGDADILDNGTKAKAFFARQVLATDPEFMDRPTAWLDSKGSPGKQTNMMEFKSSDMSTDRYVQYTNKDHPWVISLSKYGMETTQPRRGDVARMVIPAGFPKGQYVVYYLWQGYSDCTDVEYVDNTVSKIYGEAKTGGPLLRIDHCGFEDHRLLSSNCVEVVESVDECLKIANGDYYSARAGGRIVAPVIMPDSVSPHFRNHSALPWGKRRTIDQPGKKEFYCDRSQFQHATKNTFACVALQARAPSETFDYFTVTDDPTDPFFYSTCYVAQTFVQFEGLPPPKTHRDAGWRFRNQCIDCEQRALNSDLSVKPQWTTAQTCVNCDREPFTGTPTQPSFALPDPDWVKKDNVKCAGATAPARLEATTFTTAGQQAYKEMTPIGVLNSKHTQLRMDIKRCFFLVARDDECSDTIVMRTDYYQKCYCIRKGQTCTETDDGTFALYTINNRAMWKTKFLTEY